MPRGGRNDRPAAQTMLRLIAVTCLLSACVAPAWANGPLLLPDTTPPNPAALDIDGVRAKATKGDAAAAADLGAAYAHGWKVRRDTAEGVRWLTRAVTAKNRSARREMGLLLLRGDGVARDPERAVAMLTAAADGGDPIAAAALGAAFANGDGVPQSWPD